MDLDLAYSNGLFIPDADDYPERWADAAQDWRNREAAIGRARLNIAYGATERERYDLFYPAGRPEGLAVFVHGGYWRRFDRSLWSHFTQGATAAGWAMAVPSYTLAPAARISSITTQIAAAVTAAARAIEGPIALCGHSAGGHLVARLAMRDGPLPAEIAARLVGVVPISPVSDLRPLLQTAINDDLRLDAREAKVESPALHPRDPAVPVTVWVGAEERPVFLDQARWLSNAWEVPLEIAAGRHHFDVIDLLRDAGSPLIQSLLPGQP